jgi:hypothetical protein
MGSLRLAKTATPTCPFGSPGDQSGEVLEPPRVAQGDDAALLHAAHTVAIRSIRALVVEHVRRRQELDERPPEPRVEACPGGTRAET